MTEKRPAAGSRQTAARYVATRGVSWLAGGEWVNREAGDDVSDAPAGVIDGLREVAAVEAEGEGGDGDGET